MRRERRTIAGRTLFARASMPETASLETRLNAAGIYVVAKLIAHRGGKGQREFKVRWEGYAKEDE